jgi:hypothetical protein
MGRAATGVLTGIKGTSPRPLVEAPVVSGGGLKDHCIRFAKVSRSPRQPRLELLEGALRGNLVHLLPLQNRVEVGDDCFLFLVLEHYGLSTQT